MSSAARGDSLPELFTLREVARRLGIAPMTAYSWAENGRIPVLEVSSRRFVVRREVLERLIAERTKSTASETAVQSATA